MSFVPSWSSACGLRSIYYSCTIAKLLILSAVTMNVFLVYWWALVMLSPVPLIRVQSAANAVNRSVSPVAATDGFGSREHGPHDARRRVLDSDHRGHAHGLTAIQQARLRYC